MERKLPLQIKTSIAQYLLLVVLKKENGPDGGHPCLNLAERKWYLVYLPKSECHPFVFPKGHSSFCHVPLPEFHIHQLSEGNRKIGELLEYVKQSPQKFQLFYSNYSDIHIQNIIDEIKQVSLEDERERSFFLQSKIFALLQWLRRDISENEQRLEHDNVMELAAQYIAAHFDQPLSIEHLAGQFDMSESNLRLKFQQHFNQTIHQYIRKIRVEHALVLLKNPELTIAEIGYRCGFEDVSGFRRAFKKVFNTTPSSYFEE